MSKYTYLISGSVHQNNGGTGVFRNVIDRDKKILTRKDVEEIEEWVRSGAKKITGEFIITNVVLLNQED